MIGVSLIDLAEKKTEEEKYILDVWKLGEWFNILCVVSNIFHWSGNSFKSLL